MIPSKKSFRLAFFDISPDDKRVILCGRGNRPDSSNIYALNRDTLSVERVTSGSEQDMYPAVSPNGKRLLFSSVVPGGNKPGFLYLQSLDTSARTQLTASTSFDNFPAFSPDMSRMVFARAARNRRYAFGGYRWDEWDLFTAKLDGSEVRQLTKEKYKSINSCRWIPGEDLVVFGAEANNHSKGCLYVINTGGVDTPKPLIQTGYCGNLSVAARGRQIVFISDRKKEYDYDVWRMRTDGTKLAQVTSNGSYNSCPRFTSDESHILFLNDPKRLNEPELWQVGSDGTGMRRIADSSLFNDPLKWKP